MAKRIVWTLLFLISTSAAARTATAPSTKVIDQIFAQWNRPNSPGCALAVVRDGHIIYEHGYGMANLELGVPITPKSVFDIGSVSKQFTAMSILLLMHDGKLSLDDDIRKYLPEMPDYGSKITIRHLLYHTSGLRDYDDLFDLLGIPEVDFTTARDALQLVVRQKSLNFATGQAYLYSDTGYFLMSQIVERVSGQTLREFAQQRIFGPLGMTSTHFHDDHTMIVPQRATGYAPRVGGGFEVDISNFEQLGDGSVMTTAEDLFKWDQNFYHPQVGGPQIIKLMTTPGALDNGRPISYGMGLAIDEYRGLKWINHGGEWVGYRANVSRFPDQGFSTVITCNCVGSMDPERMARRIADLYLADDFKDKRVKRQAVSVSVDDPSQYVGSYWSEQTGDFRRFDLKEGKLIVYLEGESPQELVSIGNGEFGKTNLEASERNKYVFNRSPQSDSYELRSIVDGQEFSYKAVKPANNTPKQLADYAGEYTNDELLTTWTLVVNDGKLIRRQWMNWDQALQPLFADGFTGELSEGQYMLHFNRDPNNRVTGFDVATDLVRPMKFHRTEPIP